MTESMMNHIYNAITPYFLDMHHDNRIAKRDAEEAFPIVLLPTVVVVPCT
jgi:hypothetical protein